MACFLISSLITQVGTYNELRPSLHKSIEQGIKLRSCNRNADERGCLTEETSQEMEVDFVSLSS